MKKVRGKAYPGLLGQEEEHETEEYSGFDDGA